MKNVSKPNFYQGSIVSKDCRVNDDEAVDQAVQAVDVRQSPFDT